MKTIYVPDYQQSCFVATHGTHVHHMSKCMSCHKAIVMITHRAHCIHDYIYVTYVHMYIYVVYIYAHIGSVRFESSVCFRLLMILMITYTHTHIHTHTHTHTIYIYINIYIYIHIYILGNFIYISQLHIQDLRFLKKQVATKEQ